MIRSISFSSLRSKCLVCVAVLILSGCSEPVSTIDMTPGGTSVLKITPPVFLNARAIDLGDLTPEVTINREPVAVVKSGELWTGETTVPINSNVALEVRWTETFNGNALLLALARRTIDTVVENTRFVVNDESYVTTGNNISGANFDADSDGFSNLKERIDSTNPFDANSPGIDDVEPMAVIPPINTSSPVDGQFDQDFWNSAQFNDTSGQTLRIDNIIVDEPTNMVVGSPTYQWAGIHDGEFLTIFVFGKTINPPTVNATRDSGDMIFNDDTLEIFWDGNLSRLLNYDADDDMMLLIPLVRGAGATAEANKSGETNTEIERGDRVNSSVVFDVRNVEFANCLCQGERVTWEIRINLAEAQIPIGKTFGFEIQINQDDDGGGRDSKWAWALQERQPGQTTIQSDLTWRFPNQMGLIKLLPFPEPL